MPTKKKTSTPEIVTEEQAPATTEQVAEPIQAVPTEPKTVTATETTQPVDPCTTCALGIEGACVPETPEESVPTAAPENSEQKAPAIAAVTGLSDDANVFAYVKTLPNGPVDLKAASNTLGISENRIRQVWDRLYDTHRVACYMPVVVDAKKCVQCGAALYMDAIECYVCGKSQSSRTPG